MIDDDGGSLLDNIHRCILGLVSVVAFAWCSLGWGGRPDLDESVG